MLFLFLHLQEALNWTCCIILCQQTVFLMLCDLNLFSRSWSLIKWFELCSISLFWGKRGMCWGNQCLRISLNSKMTLCPDFHFSFYWLWFVPLASKNSKLTGYKIGKNRFLLGFPWQKHISLAFLNDLWWSSKSVPSCAVCCEAIWTESGAGDIYSEPYCGQMIL